MSDHSNIYVLPELLSHFLCVFRLFFLASVQPYNLLKAGHDAPCSGSWGEWGFSTGFVFIVLGVVLCLMLP